MSFVIKHKPTKANRTILIALFKKASIVYNSSSMSHTGYATMVYLRECVFKNEETFENERTGYELMEGHCENCLRGCDFHEHPIDDSRPPISEELKNKMYAEVLNQKYDAYMNYFDVYNNVVKPKKYKALSTMEYMQPLLKMLKDDGVVIKSYNHSI